MRLFAVPLSSEMVRSLVHITLSALLLGSSIGLTVNLHYCGDQLFDIALNRPAHSCCEEGHKGHQCHQDQADGCSLPCDNESIRLKPTDDYAVPDFAIDFKILHSSDILFANLILDDFPGEAPGLTARVIQYKKPPPQAVILSQIQSYLI